MLSVCAKKERKEVKNAAGENAIVVHCRRVQVVQNSQKIGFQIKEQRSEGTTYRLIIYVM